MSIASEGKIQMAQASFEPGTSRSRVLRSAAAPHWLGTDEMQRSEKLFLHPRYDIVTNKSLILAKNSKSSQGGTDIDLQFYNAQTF